MKPMIVALGLCACDGGTSPKPAEPPGWANVERLDVESWGRPCGPDKQRVESLIAWADNADWESNPYSCSLDRERGELSLLKIDAKSKAVTREAADKLISNLILPYLPPDVQLVARQLAFSPTNNFKSETRRVGRFALKSQWMVRTEDTVFEFSAELVQRQ